MGKGDDQLGFELESLASPKPWMEEGFEGSLSDEVDELFEEPQDSGAKQAKQLVEWVSTAVRGVDDALVITPDGCSACTPATSAETKGLFSFLVLNFGRVTEKLATSKPFAFEVVRGDRSKLIGLKLTQGYLCARGDKGLEVSTLASKVKSRKK